MTAPVYTVGQELYFESKHGRSGTVTITKVGRKWLELSNHRRVDKDSLCADYGSRCFLSEAQRRADLEREAAWQHLRTALPYTAPPTVTDDDIKAAARLLGVEL